MEKSIIEHELFKIRIVCEMVVNDIKADTLASGPVIDILNNISAKVGAIENHIRHLSDYTHVCEDNGYTPFENKVIKEISHIVSEDVSRPIATIVAGLHEANRFVPNTRKAKAHD